MMRIIDADWLSESIDAWRATLEATYGKNDEYVLCLGEVLGKIENAPTIEPTQSRIEKELYGKTAEEQYEFLHWLIAKYGMQYTDSRAAVIEWLVGSERRADDD